MATIDVKDAAGTTQTVGKYLPGRAGQSDSAPAVLSTEDKAALDAITAVNTGVSRSGTVTTGGASQALMSAASTRRGVVFINNSAGSLWLNDLGAAAVLAQPSIEIKAGAYWETPERYDCRQAWQVIGATTGQSFTCREY